MTQNVSNLEQLNRSTGAGRWILLVEDQPEVAEVLGEGLRQAGFRVIFAQTVQEALAKLHRQRFHCVILDLRLSMGSGEQVIHYLRQLNGTNHRTPILITSAFVDMPVLMRIRSVVQGILVKPFGIQTLLRKLEQLLQSDSWSAGAES